MHVDDEDQGSHQAPYEKRASKRRFDLSRLEKLISVVGGGLAILGALIAAGIAIFRFFFPDIPWRTEADEICLKYVDDYRAAQYQYWDEPERLELWRGKYEKLSNIEVPVEYQLDWRAYLHAEGDLLGVVTEAWSEDLQDYDSGRLAYGFGASQDSLLAHREIAAKLNLAVCGHEMDDTSTWIALRFAVDDPRGPVTTSPIESPSASKAASGGQSTGTR